MSSLRLCGTYCSWLVSIVDYLATHLYSVISNISSRHTRSNGKAIGDYLRLLKNRMAMTAPKIRTGVADSP